MLGAALLGGPPNPLAPGPKSRSCREMSTLVQVPVCQCRSAARPTLVTAMNIRMRADRRGRMFPSLQWSRRLGMRVPLVIAAVVASALATPLAQTGDILPFKATERTLPNGLKVIIVPTGFPNLVAIDIPVQVGSRNEGEPGRSGVAH